MPQKTMPETAAFRSAFDEAGNIRDDVPAQCAEVRLERGELVCATKGLSPTTPNNSRFSCDSVCLVMQYTYIKY